MLFFGKERKKKLNSIQQWDLSEKIYMLKWRGCNIIGKVKESDCKESQRLLKTLFLDSFRTTFTVSNRSRKLKISRIFSILTTKLCQIIVRLIIS